MELENSSRTTRTLNVQLHLYADDRTDEERDEQDNADGVDAKLGHLRDVTLPEHTETLGTGERTPHEKQILAERNKPIMYYHSCLTFYCYMLNTMQK